MKFRRRTDIIYITLVRRIALHRIASEWDFWSSSVLDPRRGRGSEAASRIRQKISSRGQLTTSKAPRRVLFVASSRSGRRVGPHIYIYIHAPVRTHIYIVFDRKRPKFFGKFPISAIDEIASKNAEDRNRFRGKKIPGRGVGPHPEGPSAAHHDDDDDDAGFARRFNGGSASEKYRLGLRRLNVKIKRSLAARPVRREGKARPFRSAVLRRPKTSTTTIGVN